MSREDIRDRIAQLLADITDQDTVALTDATMASEVGGWDSLVHMKLLVALESELDISFLVSELSAPRNVGELVDLIQGKLAA